MYVYFLLTCFWLELAKYGLSINTHPLQVKAQNSAGLGQGLTGGPSTVSEGKNLVQNQSSVE